MSDLIKKLSVVDDTADHSTVITDVTISLAKKVFTGNKGDSAGIQKCLDDFKDKHFSLNQNMTVNDKWNIVSTKMKDIINKFVRHRLATLRYDLRCMVYERLKENV